MGPVATDDQTTLVSLQREVSELRVEVRRLQSMLMPQEGKFQLFSAEETARIRGELAPFLRDWELPEMAVYDQDALPE